MRVLLTNDDGVRSAGIQAIRAALAPVCTSVVTVAPDGERSGFARKCTFDRPVRVRRLEGGRNPVYECDGTPTDCVRAGLLGGLAADADLVVSGINHGANVADDVVYSGTVGAGLEAAVLGTSALCLSQQTPAGSLSVNYTEHPGPGGPGYDFGLAARHGAQMAAAFGRAGPGETAVLSVNYPAAPAAGRTPDGPAVVLTRPGQRRVPAGPGQELGRRSRPAGAVPVRGAGRDHPRGRRPGRHRRGRAAARADLGDAAVRDDRAGRALTRDDLVPGPAGRPRPLVMTAGGITPLAVPPGPRPAPATAAGLVSRRGGRWLALSRKLPTVKLSASPGSDHGRNQLRAGNDAPGSAAGASAEAPGPATGRLARLRTVTWRWRSAELLAVLVLGLLVLVVHDVGYLLRHPFWTDESWVAVSTRFPVSQLPATTSSTPIGWSALLRVVTVGRTQTGRLLPLGFAGASVMIAYWFARQIGWPRRPAAVTAGLLAGIGVLLAPAMLVRNDLKQYTADACMALLTLALTSRLERKWSRWRLAGLSVSVWGGMLLSHTVAFVGIAAFGAVCAVQLARRAWRRLAEAVVAGAGTAVLMLGVYEGFDARAVVPGLTAYWADYYLPATHGLRASTTFVISRFSSVHAFFGLGPVWLGLPLFIAGLVTIFRLGRPATAIAVTALWPEMLVLSALKKYPFLDERTSTFLFAITVVVAAIGVAGLASLVRPRLKGAVGRSGGRHRRGGLHRRRSSRTCEATRSRTTPCAIRLSYVAVARRVRRRDPGEPEQQLGLCLLLAGRRAGRRADPVVSQGYEAYFPGQPRIIVAREPEPAGVNTALTLALARARQHPCSRIWLVRSHLSAAERAAWTAALRQHGLVSTRGGADGLRVVQPGRGSAGGPARCPGGAGLEALVAVRQVPAMRGGQLRRQLTWPSVTSSVRRRSA